MPTLKLFGRTDSKTKSKRLLRLTDQYWQRLGELAEAKQLDRAAYLEHYVDDLEQAKAELGIIVAGMQDLAHQDNDYIKSLTDEVEQLQEDNSDLQQQAQQVNVEWAKLQQQVQTLKTEKSELQQQVHALDIERTGLQQQVQKLAAQGVGPQQPAQPQPSRPLDSEPFQQPSVNKAAPQLQIGALPTPFLQKFLGVLLSLAILFLVGGFVLPSTVHVERRLHIDATPAAIFPLVGDLSQWPKWSPWAEMDPDMEMTIQGSGKGQVLHWHSTDPMVGTGIQEITDISPSSYVKSHLDFGDQGVADAAFSLEAVDEGTLVSWSFDSDMREGVPILKQPINTYARFFMDGLIGKDYEAGLRNIKALAEQERPPSDAVHQVYQRLTEFVANRVG